MEVKATSRHAHPKQSISGCRAIEIQRSINRRIRGRCADLRRATIGKQHSMLSGSEALVAMVQPADLQYANDTTAPRWLDGTRVGAILLE